MKKYIIAGALALALPVLGFAATFSNVQFNNGDVTISGQGGSTVNATFRVVVPAGQVVEWVSVDVVGDNLAEVETSVGGDLGLQEGTHDVTLSVKLPPNTGNYSLQIRGAGIYGGIRAINSNDNVVGTQSFSNALRVVDGSSVSNPVGGVTTDLIAQIIAALRAAGVIGSTPAPSAQSAACQALSSKLQGTTVGANTSANVRLQGFLLSEGASIPALSAGAAFGFYGSQTQAAVNAYNMSHGC